MRRWKWTADAGLYAFGHFLVDLCCALTMLSLSTDPWHFLLYNFLAFAVQMPIGLLADLLARNQRFAMLGGILVLIGMLPLGATLQVICVGFGNACYHVGGGRAALLREDGLTGLGVFVSPGALGILLGTLYYSIGWIHIVSFFSLALCSFLIWKNCRETGHTVSSRKFQPLPAVLMFVVVLLRSTVGMCMETPWKLGIFIILAAIAAAGGKALGGIVADRFGWKITATISLVAAAILFLLPDFGMVGIFGILLFNMTMPITLGKAAEACYGFEGFSFGLLTFGLFLGYLPSAFGITFSSFVGAGLALISAGLILVAPEVSDG